MGLTRREAEYYEEKNRRAAQQEIDEYFDSIKAAYRNRGGIWSPVMTHEFTRAI